MANQILFICLYYNQLSFVWQNPTQNLKGITQERQGSSTMKYTII